MERFKFGFIGGVTAPPAKELEELGQQLSITGSNFLRGGGKETSASEMVLSPLPRNTLGFGKKLWVSESFRFRALFEAVVGKGTGTISNAKVSRPLSQGW